MTAKTITLEQIHNSQDTGIPYDYSDKNTRFVYRVISMRNTVDFNVGNVLSRDQLLDLTKGRSAGPFDRAIDNQVSRLRRKIERDPRNPELIKTIWGGGYRFAAKVERS